MLHYVLESFETKMNRLMNDFNSLKNNILNNGKWNKTNQKPRNQSSSSKSPPRTKQVWLRKNRSKCQVVFNVLKVKSFREWYLDSCCSRYITGYKSSFTSLENYGGGVVTFEDGSLAWVKDKGSIAIIGYPKLDGVLYVQGLKAYLLSIGQMCDKDYKVNFYQELCEVVNKEGKIVITGHKTMDNCYDINLNSRTPLMCYKAKLDPIELWHRRLGHINYRNPVHLVNTEKVKGIPRLSGELKPIYDECMKDKQTKSSHKKVKEIKTTRPLDLLHMDLMGLMRTESKGDNRYILVVVDDFSIYSFVSFLREISEAIEHFKCLFNRIQVEIGYLIVRIKSDRGEEFDNVDMDLFCEFKGIKHEYSTSRTP